MAFDKAKVIRAAEKHLAQGKIPAAIQEYHRIVEQDPEDFTALNTLGDLYARMGRKDEAVVCFKRGADHYRAQGFALKAIAMYKKVTRYTPDDDAVAVALATLYEQQGLMVEARAQYLTVADSLGRRGSAREALEILQRVADLDPNNTDIRLRLAEGFGRAGLYDLAAGAFTEAGDRLAARSEFESALGAYTSALTLRPHDHAALHGVLTAHAALGTADEAAEILEQSVAAKLGDLELRVMLVRAYVEAEHAPQAERATRELVSRDPKSYSCYFEVARLYLQQNDFEHATGLLAQTVEQALSERAEATLLELLEEVLRRDPEHIPALQLLVRVHTWQRDDERLRTALERLAESAEAARSVEEERAALAQLVRLAPEASRHRERLAALGGAPEPEEDAPPAGDAGEAEESPTFENFMLTDSMFTAPAPPPATKHEPETQFTWETNEASPAPPADTTSSFADLNAEFTDSSGASVGRQSSETAAAAPPPSFEDFQEMAFDDHARGDLAGAGEGEHAVQRPGPAVEYMLGQELESVDFYLAQGYTDIARETLDMLERQYGASPQIDERRRRLSVATGEPVATGDVDDGFAGRTAGEPKADGAAPPSNAKPAAASKPAVSGAGLDPGLAAIFDEFREAVEDAESVQETADYETHYNLGLAYKDIELYDQAIEAFQAASQAVAPGDGTPRYLQCCNMLGHCFMRKEMAKAAAMWFKKGLESPGHTEDEYQALRYELGAAYEQMGDIRRALDTFTEVYGIDISYRGVADKLRALREQQT